MKAVVPVRIKLEFSKTSIGLFKVAAAVPAIPKVISPREPVVAQFRNVGRFLELLRDAGLAPQTHALMADSIAVAANSPAGTTCCGEVDLTPDQLKILRLDSVLQKESAR
jgi:hypothetical protein